MLHVQPTNYEMLRILRKAPPSHIGKTKSDKVGLLIMNFILRMNFKNLFLFMYCVTKHVSEWGINCCLL